MSEFCEAEKKRWGELNQFQLSNQWKKIGWTITGIAIIFLMTRKLITDALWLRFVLLNAIIIGLLIVSLSKEKIEDELIIKLRAQSYRMAFIFGVIYSLVQPYVEAGVRIIKLKLLDQSIQDVTSTFSYFQVLIFMLLVQVLFFYQLNRSR